VTATISHGTATQMRVATAAAWCADTGDLDAFMEVARRLTLADAIRLLWYSSALHASALRSLAEQTGAPEADWERLLASIDKLERTDDPGL
jgi:hypothetical protein